MHALVRMLSVAATTKTYDEKNQHFGEEGETSEVEHKPSRQGTIYLQRIPPTTAPIIMYQLVDSEPVDGGGAVAPAPLVSPPLLVLIIGSIQDRICKTEA